MFYTVIYRFEGMVLLWTLEACHSLFPVVWFCAVVLYVTNGCVKKGLQIQVEWCHRESQDRGM